MPRRRAPLALPLVLLLLAEAPLEAQTTIDFDAQACTGSAGDAFDSPFSTDGFTFTNPQGSTNAFATWCDGHQAWAGSAFFNNFLGGTTRLERTGGGFFSIQSIDLASLFLNQSMTVGFTGFYSDATTVFQQFLVGAGPFSTFSFSPDFQGLVALEWAQGTSGANFHQFDTLVFDSEAVVIPEPSTVVLTLTGLLGIAAAARIRSRRSRL